MNVSSLLIIEDLPVPRLPLSTCFGRGLFRSTAAHSTAQYCSSVPPPSNSSTPRCYTIFVTLGSMHVTQTVTRAVTRAVQHVRTTVQQCACNIGVELCLQSYVFWMGAAHSTKKYSPLVQEDSFYSCAYQYTNSIIPVMTATTAVKYNY